MNIIAFLSTRIQWTALSLASIVTVKEDVPMAYSLCSQFHYLCRVYKQILIEHEEQFRLDIIHKVAGEVQNISRTRPIDVQETYIF